MSNFVRQIIDTIEPLQDDIYGPRYRCSLTLTDGTFLPCAVLQSRERLLRLAKRRILEEINDQGKMKAADSYGPVLSSFVASGNRVNDYAVRSASESRYTIPLSLLSQIHGETTMGWTGWVFKMKDGKAFSFGSTFSYEFFHLPENYSFEDVAEVINHSFVDATGAIRSLKNGGWKDYDPNAVFRERVYFTCVVDGID